MDDLTFYNNLRNIILNSNPKDTANLATLNEVHNRLNVLEVKEQVKHWNRLCLVIEETARLFEKDNKSYVDISIDLDDNNITITNNLYTEF